MCVGLLRKRKRCASEVRLAILRTSVVKPGENTEKPVMAATLASGALGENGDLAAKSIGQVVLFLLTAVQRGFQSAVKPNL